VEFFSHQTKYPFMATRKVWYALSIALVIGSIFCLFTRGLNLGIDFTGGVAVEASFPTPPNLDQIRNKLAGAGFHAQSVATFGSSRDVAIRLPPIAANAAGAPERNAGPDPQAGPAQGESSQSATAIRARIDAVLKSIDPKAEVTDLSVVGPQVGNELKTSTVWALTFTLLLIFAYIAFRFHTWRLSLGAILAVLHDPILVLGIFSVTQTSFDLPVVAAVLAVIGYSLNDTVVVFDRIRERFEGNRRLPPAVILDQSINQTLSRTIMTKVVTSIVVVALLLLGGPVLEGFSEALLIGVIAGTYSSIYISSSIALDCGLTAEHVFPSVKGTIVDHLP
jgi:preprotein translocase subunit SecF